MMQGELVQRARDFFAERLRYGLRLGQLFLDVTDLSEGSVKTVLPPQNGVLLLDNFDCPLDSEEFQCENHELLLARKIVEYLQDQRDNLLIAQHAAAHPADKGMQTQRDILWAYGNEVYFCLSQAANNRINLTTALRVINVGQTVSHNTGFLTLVPPRFADSAVRTLVDSDLEWMAQRVRSAFVLAYDAEGYLLWERHTKR